MLAPDSCENTYLDAGAHVHITEDIAHSCSWPANTTSERTGRLSVQDREFLADLLAQVDVRSLVDLIAIDGSIISIRGNIDLRKLPLNTACVLMAVASGAKLPALTSAAVAETASGASIDDLTDRQRDVLAQLSIGASNKEIGRALRLTEGTAKIHVGAVMQRLGVANRTQAAVIGRRLLGLIQPAGA